MPEALFERVDAIEQLDDERCTLGVDAEVALQAHELADAQRHLAGEGALAAWVRRDDAELDESLDKLDFDAAAYGDVVHAEQG
jgi:hypothetical protein